ncbi:MAG: cell division topological specificity factor MinE [Myxococcales bacterium]|nr:cell division topological specificity factor MinE [Myxococcales bacterium]
MISTGKLSSFFKLWNKEQDSEKNAKSVAKQRLQFLLVHDRVHLSPGQMDELRKDLLEVLSRYVEIDEQALDVELKTLPDSRKMALVSNIPVRRVKGEGVEELAL